MKNLLRILVPGILGLNLAAYAQPGPAPAPLFGGAMDKLYGSHQSFSATLEMQLPTPSGTPMAMPAKIKFDAGKVRYEMDMAQAQGGQMPPNAAAQMKAMGMDRMVTITLPDKHTAYMIYPGMQAYIEITSSNSESATAPGDFKMKTTELGKETVDGHPCVKNKVVVTGKDGNEHESTVWNATDLKDFPVKIETADRGRKITIIYKDISFTKPDASQFEPPAGYTKYDNMQEMMRAVMMKRMGGAMGQPGMTPPHP